jgi:hypothetical protein
MDYAFRVFGRYLIIAALIFLSGLIFEMRLPTKMNGEKITAAYPLCLKLFCVCFLIFSVFFGLALAAVHRESIISRIGIFSTLGVPAAALSLEILGKKIEIETDAIVYSYFGIFLNKQMKTQVLCVGYDKTWQTFKVHFQNGSTLWISAIMRGAVQLVQKLNEQQARREGGTN